MARYYFKLIIFLLVIAGCKKEQQSDKDFKELYFDESGKTYEFSSSGSAGDPAFYTYLTIPEGAADGGNKVEYYKFAYDTSKFKDIYIHWWLGYVHLLVSSVSTLGKKATLKFPMPYSDYSATSTYKPYKVKMSKNQNMLTAVNNQANRIPITDYSWDNTGKFIIIYTNDLNAAYFIAQPKK